MKKTVARKAFAAASALIMCGNTMAFAGESTGSTTTPQFEDRVALDVVAFVGSGELDGLRSDPVSKYIEDNLNIDLYLTAVTEADWPTQLSAMLADNDLPDVFLLSDPTKQLPMLLESASVLNLEPYLEEYAPKMMDADEIKTVIQTVLSELGIETPTAKEKGKIMKELMPRVKGKADGKEVNQILASMMK